MSKPITLANTPGEKQTNYVALGDGVFEKIESECVREDHAIVFKVKTTPGGSREGIKRLQQKHHKRMLAKFGGISSE